jgi:uncharacterized membrane protein
MIKRYNSPGSTIWRLNNYGLIAATVYLFQKNKTKSLGNGTLQMVNFTELLSILDVTNQKKITEEILGILSKKITSFQVYDKKYKIKDVISSKAVSETRLKALAACIVGIHPNIIIETGTQHGVSATVISEVLSFYKINSEFITFDLKENYLLEPSIKNYRHILKSPVRRNFKELTLKLAQGKIIFFHDSDHSYENMKFEFSWAWDTLKASIIIADDIDNNEAFVKFCKKSNIKGYRLKLDNGPAVGIALRER